MMPPTKRLFLVVAAIVVSVGSGAGDEQEEDAANLLSSYILRATIQDDDFTTTEQPGPSSVASGCFFQHVEGWNRKRTCNSDDPPDATTCDPPLLEEYPETRLYTGNWESTTMISWLLQLVLSELAGVPASIETGDPITQCNFYHPTELPFEFSDFYDGSFPTFLTVHELEGDCGKQNRDANQNQSHYQPCFHIMPEVWEGENAEVQELVYNGIVEPPDAIGYLGQETWFVTAFTAEQHPAVLSYRTMAGNRRELAEIFKRPTTWQTYCEEISTDRCATPDTVARRAPQTDEEQDRMYVEGLYTGFFRATEENDCEAHATTCTGHIADYPNGWNSYVGPITYHWDIALESNGPEFGSGGYEYEQLQEIWRAANATRSNVMMVWSSPEQIYQDFINTDAEFKVVELPPPSQECLENRISIEDRESPDLQTRVGKKIGACGNPPYFPLHKVKATALRQRVEAATNKAIRSPVLEILDAFSISKLRLDEMFTRLKQHQHPRDAICSWAVDNMDFLKTFVPRTYPRAMQVEDTGTLLYIAVATGVLALCVVIATAGLLHHNRHRKAVKLAQIDFLRFLLVGALIVSTSAIITAVPPTDGLCVVSIWLINLGYTLLLVPLLVKVAAINQLMIASKKMKRFVLKPRLLYLVVAIVCVCVSVYLVLWTSLDPPLTTPEYELTGDINEDGETIVTVRYHCRSQSNTWNYVAVGWDTLLLLVATVLAFQMQNVMKANPRKGISESRTLALIIYSHFIFLLLGIITYIQLASGKVDSWTLARLLSLILSCDTMAAVLIYFLPKLVGKDIPEHMTVSSTYERTSVQTEGQNDLSMSVSERERQRQHHQRETEALISEIKRLQGELLGMQDELNIAKAAGHQHSTEELDSVKRGLASLRSGLVSLRQISSRNIVSELSEDAVGEDLVSIYEDDKGTSEKYGNKTSEVTSTAETTASRPQFTADDVIETSEVALRQGELFDASDHQSAKKVKFVS